MLLRAARDSIEAAFMHKTVYVPPRIRKSPAFSQQPGVFVTLLKKKELRGSVGYPEGTYPLIDAAVRAARDAAFTDPRFKPVKKNELPQLRIRIDILSKFKATNVKGIKAGKDGIYIKFGVFSALQLPEDARKFKWTAKEIVENTLRKAGLAPEMWNDTNLRIYKFTAKAFQEE